MWFEHDLQEPDLNMRRILKNEHMITFLLTRIKDLAYDMSGIFFKNTCDFMLFMKIKKKKKISSMWMVLEIHINKGIVQAIINQSCNKYTI